MVYGLAIEPRQVAQRFEHRGVAQQEKVVQLTAVNSSIRMHKYRNGWNVPSDHSDEFNFSAIELRATTNDHSSGVARIGDRRLPMAGVILRPQSPVESLFKKGEMGGDNRFPIGDADHAHVGPI